MWFLDWLANAILLTFLSAVIFRLFDWAFFAEPRPVRYRIMACILGPVFATLFATGVF